MRKRSHKTLYKAIYYLVTLRIKKALALWDIYRLVNDVRAARGKQSGEWKGLEMEKVFRRWGMEWPE